MVIIASPKGGGEQIINCSSSVWVLAVVPLVEEGRVVVVLLYSTEEASFVHRCSSSRHIGDTNCTLFCRSVFCRRSYVDLTGQWRSAPTECVPELNCRCSVCAQSLHSTVFPHQMTNCAWLSHAIPFLSDTHLRLNDASLRKEKERESGASS